MTFKLSDTIQEAEKKYSIGKGDYFKVQEGDNRVRVVSQLRPLPGTYQGKPTFKWLCYVLDRRDGKVKPYFMPHTIAKSLDALQSDPDYLFDDMPMPYDINVKTKNAGMKEVEYTVIPALSKPLTAEEQKEISDRSIDELLKKVQEGDSKTPPPQQSAHPTGNPEISVEDIPF
jgi:hypothetical protein